MKFTTISQIAQPGRQLIPIMAVLAVVSCSGGSSVLPPASPEATVRGFLNAVNANSLVAMGEFWGTKGGPASEKMDADVWQQRLTIMKVYLEHEEFQIVSDGGLSPKFGIKPGEQVVYVQITRNGCTPVVPFTLITYRGGWLISEIDLEARGNPVRHCGTD